VQLVRAKVDAYLAKIRPNLDIEEPSDGYFEAFLMMSDSRTETDTDDEKLKHLGQAYSNLLGLKETKAEWKPKLVSAKIQELRHQIGLVLNR